MVQSTLSKADTLGTKATVQFREVSGLGRSSVTEMQVQFGRKWTKFAVRFRACPLRES